MNEKFNDIYNPIKAQAKAVVSNSTYLKNILLAVSAGIVVLVSANAFGINAESLSSFAWWISRIEQTVAMCMLFLSINSIYNEKNRQTSSFIVSKNLFADKVRCCNENQDKDTYKGLMEEVNEFNRLECERIWRDKLRGAIGSLVGREELAELNKDFDTFQKLTDEWWKKYFEEKKFKPKALKKARKVIQKIRDNKIKIKRLITMDAVLYDTFRDKETVSPVYNERPDILRGLLYRAVSMASISVMLASVFWKESPDVLGWIYAIVGCAFMISTTFFTAYNLAQKMDIHRRNSLKKRINILEAAFNRCQLPNDIRARYYKDLRNTEQ